MANANMSGAKSSGLTRERSFVRMSQAANKRRSLAIQPMSSELDALQNQQLRSKPAIEIYRPPSNGLDTMYKLIWMIMIHNRIWKAMCQMRKEKMWTLKRFFVIWSWRDKKVAHICPIQTSRNDTLFANEANTRQSIISSLDKCVAVLKSHFSCIVTGTFQTSSVKSHSVCYLILLNGHISIETQNKLLNLKSACSNISWLSFLFSPLKIIAAQLLLPLIMRNLRIIMKWYFCFIKYIFVCIRVFIFIF